MKEDEMSILDALCLLLEQAGKERGLDDVSAFHQAKECLENE